MTDRKVPAAKSRWLKVTILAVFVSGLAAFFLLGGQQWLSLDTLKEHRADLLGYTEQHYFTMLLLCGLTYAIATAFSVPGALILSLTVGFLFGRWVGTLVIVLAATIGATLVFLGARYLFADLAQRKAGGFAKKMIEGFKDNAFNYLLFLRLVPLFPFWLVNLAPAFTPIRVRTYVTATAIGIIPGSFVFANLGQSLGRIESIEQLVSGEILAALALLGLFALIPIAVNKFKTKRNPMESL